MSASELPAAAPEAVSPHPLRQVRMEDLLGRPPVILDLSPVAADLHERVVLLTGAAGSIGSELARLIARFQPARLVLLDQAESDLYFVYLELSEAYPDLDLVPAICDITASTRLAQVFAQHHPDYVLHAAAYKQVPLMETQVSEAVRNNVLGTLLVATTAVRYGAKKVLLLSTDEAIKPASIVGATKRVAERIIFGLPHLHRSGTDFRAVRFGNVLASTGSVVPLFQRQLAMGGPITVTHPLAERYFLTIPEAAQLVLQAGSLPESAGAIAMLEMGEPVRILDLAENLIRFSGRVPGRDVSITFTGLRPGEKLTGDQVPAGEASVPTSSTKIRASQPPDAAGPDLVDKLSRLLTCLEAGDQRALRSALCDLVPESVPPLRDAQIQPGRAEPGDNRNRVGDWEALMDSSQPRWRERRHAARHTPPPDRHLVERRQGIACRRKAARAGGRRRTDLEVWLPTGSAPSL